jgi:hypothetical protein
VTRFPITSAWMWSVPSYVFTASRLQRCRMIGYSSVIPLTPSRSRLSRAQSSAILALFRLSIDTCAGSDRGPVRDPSFFPIQRQVALSRRSLHFDLNNRNIAVCGGRYTATQKVVAREPVACILSPETIEFFDHTGGFNESEKNTTRTVRSGNAPEPTERSGCFDSSRSIIPPAKPADNGTILAYIGAYSNHGEGIYLYHVNSSTGALTKIKVFPSTVNPSWISFGPTKRFLYSANEISNFNGGTTGSVTAYAVNPANGDLTALNTVTSGGAGPAHLSVDPLGKYVFVANYGGGNVAVIPIQANGSLGSPTDVVSDTTACSPACPLGPTHAAKALPAALPSAATTRPTRHRSYRELPLRM